MGQQRSDDVTPVATRTPQTYEEWRDMPCVNHMDANGKSTHTNRTCKWVNELKADPEAGYKRSRRPRPRGRGKADKSNKETREPSDMEEDTEPRPPKKSDGGGKGDNPYEKNNGVFHTFLGTPSAKAQKKILRALNTTVPAMPRYLKWSEYPIIYDRADHPGAIPSIGNYALLVNPLIHGYEFTKCLMDGGSSINIMYIATLLKVGLNETHLMHSNTVFHRVVPGWKAQSIRSITLMVSFGSAKNFR